MATLLETSFSQFEVAPIVRVYGKIKRISGQSVFVSGMGHILEQGAFVRTWDSDGGALDGEVIALDAGEALIALYGDSLALKIGQRVEHIPPPQFYPSTDWVGKVLDYQGQTVDGVKPRAGKRPISLNGAPPHAILRKSLGLRLHTATAALDSFLPLCCGQRVGLFAGSGVGKSTLLANLAKSSDADINIIALIGERGREVRHFVEKTLGEEGMKKSIVFVATSDMSSAIKLRTAQLAMATAEYFRDAGQQVLYLFDSVTRYAEAHRDLALSAGEVPALRAYPPSTFRSMAALCERAGPGVDGAGDITAIFSVLVAGSNMEEPVADMVRGILDGHIVLDRDIAERGRFPAINIRQSVSRSLPDAATAEQNALLRQAREHIMRFEESRSLIQAGLYVSGSDPKLDAAISVYDALDGFVGESGHAGIGETFAALDKIISGSPENND